MPTTIPPTKNKKCLVTAKPKTFSPTVNLRRAGILIFILTFISSLPSFKSLYAQSKKIKLDSITYEMCNFSGEDCHKNLTITFDFRKDTLIQLEKKYVKSMDSILFQESKFLIDSIGRSLYYLSSRNGGGVEYKKKLKGNKLLQESTLDFKRKDKTFTSDIYYNYKEDELMHIDHVGPEKEKLTQEVRTDGWGRVIYLSPKITDEKALEELGKYYSYENESSKFPNVMKTKTFLYEKTYTTILELTLDEDNRVLHSNKNKISSDGTENSFFTIYTYNPDGTISSIQNDKPTDPGSSYTNYSYDKDGNLIEHHFKSPIRGKVTSEVKYLIEYPDGIESTLPIEYYPYLSQKHWILDYQPTLGHLFQLEEIGIALPRDPLIKKIPSKISYYLMDRKNGGMYLKETVNFHFSEM